MASTSSSQKPHYDVFINHRGPDVKHKLASTIYQMLDLIGVQAFLDQDVLELGDPFPEEIKEAIDSALVHIAIFSPKYAESPWCLDELLWMLETKAPIIPVFYDVQPSDLRHARKGMYANAFHQYKKKRRHDPQQIKEWEEALKRVSNLSGSIMGGEGDERDEGKLLRNIVEAVKAQVKAPSDVASFCVGLDEAVEDFESKVGSSAGSQNVQIVGIAGMGGSGKTTLAKELYIRKRSSFTKSSFLSDVSGAASKDKLQNLKNKLLNDLYMGRSARYSRPMTALIVLDNVDAVDQIHDLLPPKHDLGRGSFIIVTTRDKDVLASLGFSSIYNMKLLDRFNAQQLFCRYAFLNPYSEYGFQYAVENYESFKALIQRFVVACKGLPLSLKVLGAMLNGKSKAYWESQLLKIAILPTKIIESLKLSYNALDSQVRKMFLDTACFFIGVQKSLVVAIWDGSGWQGELGWETLVNKCLVYLSDDGRIDMHDHLRDMGREIAREVSPYRIFKEEDLSIQGGGPIRGIVASATVPPSLSWPPLWFTVYSYSPRLEMIMNRPYRSTLQLLAIRGNYLREEFAALSTYLVWLRWFDFDGINLPSWLSFASLRVLELCNASNLQALWEANVEPPLQLRELIIYLNGRTCFRGLPRSIEQLMVLKKIVLNGSGNRMERLPEEFCKLKSLECVELSDFPALSSLPDHIGKLRNLRVLVLSKVPLTVLPDSFKDLELLQILDISDSKSFTFTSEMLHALKLMRELKTLRISNCPLLKKLPHLTSQVSSLRELKLRHTGLRELPDNISQLTKLETLVVASQKLRSLPESVGKLPCLTSLTISWCSMLEYLPETLGSLSNLRSLTIDSTPVEGIGLGMGTMGSTRGCNLKCLSLINTRVRRISISDDCCPNLETVELLNNYDLTDIETLPRNVREIRVQRCEKLKNMTGIGNLQNLKMLQVDDCPDLEMFPSLTHEHSARCKITIRGCPKLKQYYEDEPLWPPSDSPCYQARKRYRLEEPS